jgi:hypothetical protein
MHAIALALRLGQPDPDLPEHQQTLTSPLVVHPFGGGDGYLYNIIRDHKLQSYHQLAYAGPQYA